MIAPEKTGEIESRKIALEIEKFEYQKKQDELRAKTDIRSKRWAQLSVLIPIVAIIISFLTNSVLERNKIASASRQEQLRSDREFINKQLSDFYYPIFLRLEKDSATWTLASQLSKDVRARTTPQFSDYIESDILIPNHEETIKIIDDGLSLIKNGRERYDPSALISAVKKYQRHVAAYRALRAINDFSSNPIELCSDCKFPAEFPKLISERIKDLEAQRAALSDELRGLED